MALYYQYLKTDLVEAANMCKKSVSLAILAGNAKRHSEGLRALAWINIQLGRYPIAQMHAFEAQKLARVSGDLYTEAAAARAEALCWQMLGHYKQSLSLGIRAQSLVTLCGMSSSAVALSIMTTQAEVHKCKSEYSEAWKIYTEIDQIFANQGPYWHAAVLLNMAEI
jgi:tetratricopeptide (TPR) repeat protein